MNQGKIYIFSGDGHGKTPAAIGHAIYAANENKNVIIIQFLKGKAIQNSAFMKRLEPEIKFFQFEKSEMNYDKLSDERKAEEIQNIRNGLNFTKKVITTSGCDLLILDEILGLIDVGILSVDELKSLLEQKSKEMTIIMTGITLCDEVCVLADEVSKIEKLNFKVF